MASKSSPNIIHLTFKAPLKKYSKTHSRNYFKYCQENRHDIKRAVSKEQMTEGTGFSHLIRSLRDPREEQKIENGVWKSEKKQLGILKKNKKKIEDLLGKQCIIRDVISKRKDSRKTKTEHDHPQLKVRKKRQSYQQFVHHRRLSGMSQSIIRKQSLQSEYQSSAMHQTINHKMTELKSSLNASKITIPGINKEIEKNKYDHVLGILGIARKKDQNMQKWAKGKKKQNKQRQQQKQRFQIINIQRIKETIQTKYLTIEDEKSMSFTQSVDDQKILQSHYLD